MAKRRKEWRGFKKPKVILFLRVVATPLVRFNVDQSTLKVCWLGRKFSSLFEAPLTESFKI